MSAKPQVEVIGVLYDIFRPANCGNFFKAKIHPIRDGQPSLAESINVIGSADEDELKLQMTYRWYGTKEVHETYGPQLKCTTFTPARPHGRVGVVKYLQECDGIGEATAEKIWKMWQSDAVRICREHPEIVSSQVAGINEEKAKKISEQLTALQALEATSIDLMELLSGRKFRKALPRWLVRKYGVKAPAVIQHDPFRLRSFPGCGFDGCDSMYKDLGLPLDRMKRQVYAALHCLESDNGGNCWTSSEKIKQFMKSKTSIGKVNFERAVAIAQRAKKIATHRHCSKCNGTGVAMVPDLFFGDELTEGTCTSCGGSGGSLWLAESKLANAEDYVARHIAQAEMETNPQSILTYDTKVKEVRELPTYTRCTRCHRKLTAEIVHVLDDQPYGPDCITKVSGGSGASAIPLANWLESQGTVTTRITREYCTGSKAIEFFNAWPAADELEGISEHQKDEYGKATTGRIGILTGTAGTGKTFTMAAIVRVLIAKYGIDSVAIASPTGKAAVRCTEAMDELGIKISATTIHRLLGVEQADDNDGWMFRHKENNPLPYQFIIVDETSMISIDLMASLLRARARGTHVLFIGDPNQLAPVGPGCPLRDFITAGIPCGELKEIHRNSGTIVRACAALRDGKPMPYDDEIDLTCDSPKNLKLVVAQKHEVVPKLNEVLQEIGTGLKVNPHDSQVIVAVNKRSPLSRKTMNVWLQEKLNPHGRAVPGSPFRQNDKLINVKNQFYKSVVAGEQSFISNGDTGRAITVAIRETLIEFQSPVRQVRVSRIPESPKKDDKPNDSDDKDESTGTGCDIDLAWSITCHKCVSPDTIIETSRGLIEIRNTDGTGGVIGTPIGPRRYQNKVFYDNASCLKIETQDSYEITVTENHKCEKWNGEEFVLVNGNELQIGDFVRVALFATCEPCEVAILPPRPESDIRAANWNFPSIMTLELAEFLGMMVADGVIHHGGIRLGKRHFEVARRFTFLAKSIFGFTANEYEKDGMLVSDIQSTEIANWIRSIGGCNPKTKHTPDCVMQSPMEYHAVFLRGLFEDGTANDRNGTIDHVEWSTCFPLLFKQVRTMLARLGIITGKNSRRKKHYALYIYGQEIVKFAKLIGFISEFKQSRLSLKKAKQTKYRIPLSNNFAERNSQYFSRSNKVNLRNAGYLSRNTIQKMESSGCLEAGELLKWHYTRIAKITPVISPVVCVEVPDGHRFMQNGLPWGNSQGSQYPVSVILLDEYAGATGTFGICDMHWLLTAISRAKVACYMIGLPETIEKIARKRSTQNRKTFLKELIEKYRKEYAQTITSIASPTIPTITLNGVTECRTLTTA